MNSEKSYERRIKSLFNQKEKGTNRKSSKFIRSLSGKRKKILWFPTHKSSGVWKN